MCKYVKYMKAIICLPQNKTNEQMCLNDCFITYILMCINMELYILSCTFENN